nr:uncharacterized protein LOC117861475 [Setaria viridis]
MVNKGKKPKVQVRHGRLNFTNVAELPEGAPVMTEVNIADGTYELHPTPEEKVVADLHHAEVEPVLEQAEDQFANSECEGEDDVSEFAASSAWSTQLPPGWTVEWDPSSDGEDRGQ